MNREIKRAVLILLAPVLISSCNAKKVAEPENMDSRLQLMDADRTFSKLSEKKGIKNASLQCIDNKGILLRPNSFPLVGGNAIDYISQGNDTSFILTWDPNGGAIAASGDLGYTYGIYSLKPKNQDTVYYGTYIRIWKKQPDGKWKFALETGNEGVGE